MIYLVSTTRFLFNAPDIKPVSVQESLQVLEPLKIVGLDTETTGLDPYTKELKLVQLGCKDFQVVIDTTTVDIVRYKEYLESNRLILLWNAKFDLKWFYKYGIIIKNVYDGFLAEKLMWLGYPAGIHSMSLKTAGEEYLGIELDKSVRGKIIYSNLDEEIIRYGAADVQWLETIREKQLEKLREKQLIVALDIENRFVRVLAYIEWCGVKLDVKCIEFGHYRCYPYELPNPRLIINFERGTIDGYIEGELTASVRELILNLLEKYHVYMWSQNEYHLKSNAYDPDDLEGYDWYLEIVFKGDVIWHIFGYNDYPDTYVFLAREIIDITGMDLLEMNTIDDDNLKLFEKYGNAKLE